MATRAEMTVGYDIIPEERRIQEFFRDAGIHLRQHLEQSQEGQDFLAAVKVMRTHGDWDSGAKGPVVALKGEGGRIVWVGRCPTNENLSRACVTVGSCVAG